MLYHDVVKKIKKQFLQTDVSNYEGKLAIQFNLTGDEGESGWFYVEILNGKLSIEEYTYDDRDAEITISGEDLLAIASGKLNPQLAYVAGKLKINGDIGKALQISLFIKEAKKTAKKTTEKKAATKTTTKKTATKKPATKKAPAKKEAKAETKPVEKKVEAPKAETKPAEKKVEAPKAETKPAEKKVEAPKAETKPAEKKVEAPKTEIKPAAKKTK